MSEPFKDRAQAGAVLAQKLQEYAHSTNLLVLGLPRGGVVVASVVAASLGAKLDVFIVRKLGVPYQPELAMGAIAEDGFVFLNETIVNYLGISKNAVDTVVNEELSELKRRVMLYRHGKGAPDIKGHTVIVVDDGVATGATMKVALRAIRKKGPEKLVVAVPVCSQSACSELQKEADKVICVLAPESFTAVGSWYEDFEQTSDDQVCQELERVNRHEK